LAADKLGIVIVAEKELAMHTLSVETGTAPLLQLLTVVHLLSPAAPVQLLLPAPQVTVAECGALRLILPEAIDAPRMRFRTAGLG
jgi:hypothetical protein